jgi:DNA topoisomerase-1
MTTLVIVESPAKCRKIEGYLGSGFTCMASCGHIRGLDNSLGIKCINVEGDFEPTFKVLSEKQKQVNALRREIAKAKEVILATDDDREGEGIAWHICEVFGLPVGTTKRIVFHEITKPAIQAAMTHPGHINMNVVHAQIARQVLDCLVGFTLSPMLWTHIARNSKAKLSAGRCQTPALRLVYDNQQDINASPGKKVYNTTGFFMKQNIPYVLDHQYTTEEEMDTFLEESVHFDHGYSRNEPRASVKQPPKPLTTSGLQQAASSILRISPKDTMRSAQKLYEGGYITYMRTDSKTYSAEFLEGIQAKIIKDYGEEYVKSDIATLSERKEDKKNKPKKGKQEGNTQEAHEAIRPTKVDVLEVDLSPREQRLYTLIWKTTMESCMSPAQCMILSTSITAPNKHIYKYSAEEIIFMGWMVVSGKKEKNPIYKYLSSVKVGILPYRKVSSKLTMKETKSHYTEARLVQLLEQKGIGRPSTFSSIIDKIQERKYVTKGDIIGKTESCVDFELEDSTIERIVNERDFGNEKSKLAIQPIGQLVIEFLVKHYDTIMNYEYTKEMEDRLDLISKGEQEWQSLCRECYGEIMRISLPLQKSHESKKISVRIDEYHVYIIGKHGPVIKMYKDGVTSFKPVKEGIDLNDLKKGTLTLADIVQDKAGTATILGKYEGHDLILKKGRYGLYVAWGNKTKSFSWLKEEEKDVSYEFIVEHIQKSSANMVREISANISIRNGKYGNYLFYKTDGMTKPKFVTLRDFTEDYMSCEVGAIEEYVHTKV